MSTASNPAAVTAAKVRSILAGASKPGPDRQVTVRTPHCSHTVACPWWCTATHTEIHNSIVDVSHHSTWQSLSVPVHGGTVDEVLSFRIMSWPFASDPATIEPYICYSPLSDECAQLTPAAALAATDQGIAHMYRMRGVINGLIGAERPADDCRVVGCDGYFHYETPNDSTCSHVLGKLTVGTSTVDVEVHADHIDESKPVQASVFVAGSMVHETLLRTSDPAELTALAAQFRAFADTIDRAAVQLGGQS